MAGPRADATAGHSASRAQAGVVAARGEWFEAGQGLCLAELIRRAGLDGDSWRSRYEGSWKRQKHRQKQPHKMGFSWKQPTRDQLPWRQVDGRHAGRRRRSSRGPVGGVEKDKSALPSDSQTWRICTHSSPARHVRLSRKIARWYYLHIPSMVRMGIGSDGGRIEHGWLGGESDKGRCEKPTRVGELDQGGCVCSYRTDEMLQRNGDGILPMPIPTHSGGLVVPSQTRTCRQAREGAQFHE